VQRHCACAEPKLTKNRLIPGEGTTLTVTWKVGSQRGPRGEVVWLDGQTETGIRFSRPVRLQALVAGHVNPNPWSLELVDAEWSEVHCTTRDGRAFQILEAVVSHPGLVVEVVATDRVRIRKAPEANLLGGLLLQIRTDHPQEEWVEVPVRWRSSAMETNRSPLP